jgi:hypothetical protein
MPTTGPILASITDISNFLLSYAGTLAALGALTVAIVEAWKKLFSAQAKFHRASMLRWFQNDERTKKAHYFAQPMARSAEAALGAYDQGRAYEQLLELTTGVGRVEHPSARRYDASLTLAKKGQFSRSIEYALFELEVDRLMGQIQDAADVALNNPKLYPDLFRFLTRSALPDDVTNWVTEVGELVASRDTDDRKRKEISDRFTRLKQTVRRHLDSFQIVTAMRWREWNQLAAVLIGAALLLSAQVLALAHDAEGHWKTWADFTSEFSGHPLLWLKIIFVSLFGGMLAPVAKDLVDALRKVKASV